MSIYLIPLVALVVASPIIATVLGWIAVTQIRRSQGKLCGLGLAVFDGLLFPLLALDALIVALCTTVTKMFVTFYANPALQNRPDVDPALVTKLANLLASHPAVLFPVIAAIVIVVDVLIIRAVWRAVNKSASTPIPPPSAGVTASPPSPEVPMIGRTGHADFQSLETTNAVLMTPEEMGTARGQFGMAFTRGPLVLDGTRLVHRGNGKETVIPLAAIEDVSLGHFPRAMNPRRMELVCVTYRLDGRTQRIVFAPWERMVGRPSLFNDRVRAWHQLVRSAVHRNTGRMPTETAEAQLNMPRSSPLTVAVMASPYVFGIGALWATTSIQSAGNLPDHLRWLLWMPALPLLIMALAWIAPTRSTPTAAKPRSALLALLAPLVAVAICVGAFVVGMRLRPHIQPPTGPFKVQYTPEGVTGRVVLVRMFTPDPLVRQEVRMHLAGPELPVEDLQIPRNFTHRPRPDHFIFPRPSPAIQPWTDFGSSKQTLMGFVLPTPELAQEAYRRLAMGPLPMTFDRDRPPGTFHFDLDPARPETMTCILFDVTNAVGEHFTGKLLFSATWVRAGRPRWAEVKIRPIKKSLNTIELSWEVVTEKPAAMTLRHRWQDGGSETMAAFPQPSPNVHASVLVYKMTETRVGMRMTLGDQPSTKEFDGDFDAIAEELSVYSGGGRIKTERDWDIELCRVAKEPVYLRISDLPGTQRVEFERNPAGLHDPEWVEVKWMGSKKQPPFSVGPQKLPGFHRFLWLVRASRHGTVEVVDPQGKSMSAPLVESGEGDWFETTYALELVPAAAGGTEVRRAAGTNVLVVTDPRPYERLSNEIEPSARSATAVRNQPVALHRLEPADSPSVTLTVVDDAKGDPRRFPAVKCFVNFTGSGPDAGCVGDAGTNGTMRCGHPGAVSEVSWSWLRKTPTGDLYQFARTFPASPATGADTPEHAGKQQVTTREVEYTGNELVVWEDAVHRIGLRPLPRLQIRVEAGTNESAETVSNHDGNERIRLRRDVLLDETSVARAAVTPGETGWPVISVTFTETGAKRFARITRENLNRRLAIVFDGVLLSAPILRSEISGGRVDISGHFTPTVASAIARALNQGATTISPPSTKPGTAKPLPPSSGRSSRWREPARKTWKPGGESRALSRTGYGSRWTEKE